LANASFVQMDWVTSHADQRVPLVSTLAQGDHFVGMPLLEMAITSLV